MPIRAGDTFLFDPGGANNPHLWIVVIVYVPELDTTEYAVIANVTTVKNPKFADPACRLGPTNSDKHRFIRDESYVFYREMRTVETSALASAMCHDPVSPDVLQRVQRGALASAHTARGLKATLRELLPKC